MYRIDLLGYNNSIESDPTPMLEALDQLIALSPVALEGNIYTIMDPSCQPLEATLDPTMPIFPASR